MALIENQWRSVKMKKALPWEKKSVGSAALLPHRSTSLFSRLELLENFTQKQTNSVSVQRGAILYYGGAPLLGSGPLGRLWALRACLTTTFTPFGRSGRVTLADIDKSLDLEKFSKRNYSWLSLSLEK